MPTPTRDQPVDFAADDRRLVGTLVSPAARRPGILFIHGWGGSQDQYIARAREIAALGCVCLTFNLSGNLTTDATYEATTREHSLGDIVAAYKLLSGHPDVDPTAIGVIASSYGGYLAAILTTLHPVRWLGLRAPALYKDEDWHTPKFLLKREELAAYRRVLLQPGDNRALAACALFTGHVLLVESEHDHVVPKQVVANYRAAFEKAHSLTYRLIEGGDHGLTDNSQQIAYTKILLRWATETVLAAQPQSAVGKESTG